jgi:hypothetical protein
MHQASKAQKTPGLPIVANARWSCQFYLIFNFYRLEDPLDDSLRFCYDVPRPQASHTAGGYRQQYLCGKAHRGMVEYNGRKWGVTYPESVVWLREPY